MTPVANWSTSTTSPEYPYGHTSGDYDVVELPLLLPEWQVIALESVANERGMTIGQLLRRLISDMLPPHTH